MDTNTNTIAQLQKSVRRLRYGMAAIAIGAGVFVMGAMQDQQSRDVGPHLVSISATPATRPGLTTLFRLWSDGSIDRSVVDNGVTKSNWQIVQR